MHDLVPTRFWSRETFLLLSLTCLAWMLGDRFERSVAYGYQEAGGGAAAAPAAAEKSAEELELERRRGESFLMWMIRASGIFGFLILLVSFAMVALIMMLFLQLQRGNFLPADFLADFEQKLNAKDYQGAYELSRGDDSYIGRVLAAGMGRLQRGYDDVVAGMQEVGDDETMSLEHKLSYMALIGSIAPMLGLLGTVQGMVLSFQVIATSPTAPKPYQLADGIATALFTTLEGLVVAIPAIFSFLVFKNRLSRLTFECAITSENLMSRFSGIGKPKA